MVFTYELIHMHVCKAKETLPPLRHKQHTINCVSHEFSSKGCSCAPNRAYGTSE